MFVGKESNSSRWKQWAIGLVDNTLSSVDQAISGWFWNLINDLPRDYFAKTFDQVNYFDQSVWEGIFRARIEDIKEQLESGISKKTFEADIIKLQGLIGKHSLSPLVYEDGLKELEDFMSDSNNPGKHLQLLANVRNEFREELRAQPLLLKECIKNDTNLGQREAAYYQSLLDSASSKETPVQPSALGKSVVRKNGVTNSKLRNISKLLFCNPAQAVMLFLVGQVAFANAVSIQLNNSSAVENSTLPFEDKLFTFSEAKEGLKSTRYSTPNKAAILKNGLEAIEEKADGVEEILANSTLLPFSSNVTDAGEIIEKIITSTENSTSKFIEVPKGKVEDLKDMVDKLIKALVQSGKSKESVQRSKRFANSSGTFTRPSSNNKISMLENEVKKLKEGIDGLKSSVAITNKDKRLLSSLAASLELLQKQMDDQSRSSDQQSQACTADIERLTSKINRFNQELDSIKRIAEKDECVRDVEAHRFEAAEQKLAQINDDTEINRIIKKVYNHQVGNFDLVLKFGDSIKNIRRSFLVYKALNYEMESNEYKDPFKMIKLIESFRKKIINQSNTSSEIKGEAESLASSLKDRVKAVAKEKLKDGMLYDRYKSNTEITELSNTIYSFDNELFKDLLKEVVNDVYYRIDTEKILEYIKSHSYIEQLISGCMVVFDKMQSRSDLNNSALFKLAYYIKEIMEMDNYPNVHLEKRSDLESVKSRLPGSVKNSVFSSKVCIKNVEYGRYLYSPNDYKDFQFDSERRRVFTWPSKEGNDQFKWKVEPNGDNVYLKNVEYGRYLYSPNDYRGFQFGSERRRVFTWPSKEGNDQFKWKVEPNGDNVYLKNVEYGRYLYSPNDYRDFQFGSERRRVFTWPSNLGGDQFKWKVENCGSTRERRDVEEILEERNGMDNITVYEQSDTEENAQPSSHISDIILEKIKTTDKNISSVAR